MKIIDQKGFSHHVLLVVFVLAFAGIGAVTLSGIFAAKGPKGGSGGSTSPIYTIISNGNSIDAERSTNYNITDEAVSGFGIQKVVHINEGGTLNLGGKGGGNPIFIKRCYSLRPTTSSATVELWGINNTEIITLNEGEIPLHFQEVCINENRKSGEFKNAIKVTTGSVDYLYSTLHFYIQ